MSEIENPQTILNGKNNNQEVNKPQGGQGNNLWKDGLIFAFEFIRGHRSATHSTPRRGTPNVKKQVHTRTISSGAIPESDIDLNKSISNEGAAGVPQIYDSHWVPIGWERIKELVQMVRVDEKWDSEQICLAEDEDDFTVAGVAAPYWERPVGPTWWCHVNPAHQSIQSWLSGAHWLHPAISIALRDENRLISERMKHLLYEVPVRVAGGLLFELLGQSIADPFSDEDDIPIVLRSWQAQNFLITALHIKGSASNINVLGITEVQELLLAGGSTAPKSVHEVIAHLACRLSRWDDRMFRKLVFGAADEIELKFVNRRNHEDLNLLSSILNQEIRRLARQVIRVKWSLHAREEIVFELVQYLRGINTKHMLEGIKKSTREMLEEQEAVRGRLFTIQDVLQNTVRAWLQMAYQERKILPMLLACLLDFSSSLGSY
ncbi:uncharacterized protein LOC109826286 isoform X2 [Asparagus officinalis]|uniref:uncharacterized protein LOC109826286 isoform X2 n=1 Tax=Asparagus officinalis TaxID=4686 RepID=UPI00098E424C|nr:uncharacterized protein LOC109826286 isoform X2 [Asparagus officinalis]